MASKKADFPSLFLFTDEPMRSHESDHLALRPFSTMVAAAALSNRGPFNIGVFSGWGQGKTSVLRQAQSLIEAQQKPNVITAWVNAWQYEHEEHPIVPLLAVIINEITKALDARGESLGEKGMEATKKTLGDLKRALRAIAYGFSAKTGVKIPGFANLEIGFVAKDMIDRDEKLSSDRDPLLDQSLYYHAYDRLEKFRVEIESHPAADAPKIIVFIDDLDRCQPDKALHLLESIKLVLAQPGFIFVLAVDRQVIDSFLTKRYHENFGIPAEKGHGRQYMDKIIQLPLDLPHHEHRFENYIGQLVNDPLRDGTIPVEFITLFNDTDAGKAFTAALATGCARSPRTLIRTLNYLLTDLFLRQQDFFKTEDDPFKNDHAEFLQFAAISRITRITFGSDHERAYRSFVESDLACDTTAQVYSATKNTAERLFGDGTETLNELGETSSPILKACWNVITASDSLQELFRTPLGHTWLKEHTKRKAIEGYLATREDPQQEPDADSLAIINAAIRKSIDHKGDSLSDEDRAKVTELDLRGAAVKDLTPLKRLPNLKNLLLSDTQVSDLSPLSGISGLWRLWLHGTPVSRDKAAIAQLKKDLPNVEIYI